jgi:hypothetical protein
MPAAVRRARERDKQPVLQRFCFGMLVLVVLLAAFARSRAEPAGEDTLVLAADTSLSDAMRAGDRSVARKLLSLQFTYTDENGEIHERKAFLGDLKNLAAAPAIDVKVAIYGLVAMVTGHRKSAQGNNAFFLDIWAKQKGAWRALNMQDVVLSDEETPRVLPDTPEAPGIEAKLYECKNPCQTIPYRVRSPAEQDIVNAFQAIERATIAHDDVEYSKHVADEFVHYRSGYAPISKSGRLAIIHSQKEHNIPALLSELQSMRLWVFGDGAAMISSNGVPSSAEPLIRIARIWVRRNGQWQMAISAQTLVKAAE